MLKGIPGYWSVKINTIARTPLIVEIDLKNLEVGM